MANLLLDYTQDYDKYQLKCCFTIEYLILSIYHISFSINLLSFTKDNVPKIFIFDSYPAPTPFVYKVIFLVRNYLCFRCHIIEIIFHECSF